MQNKTSHITTFIVDTPDYFAAHTDVGSIRFGLVGATCFEISYDHFAATDILSCTSSDDVESIFDEFMSRT